MYTIYATNSWHRRHMGSDDDSRDSAGAEHCATPSMPFIFVI